MPSQKSFGRRAASQNSIASGPRPETRNTQPAEEVAERVVDAEPASGAMAADGEQSVDVDRELEEWKAARKLQRRSFREPWRTLAIAATVGFGLSSWLLPDSVSDVAQLVTGGLGAASFFAGFRVRPPAQKLSSGFGG
jgi:hypothetical protein